MKKILALICALCMIFTLAACAKTDAPDNSTDSTAAETTTNTDSTAAADTAKDRNLTVGSTLTARYPDGSSERLTVACATMPANPEPATVSPTTTTPEGTDAAAGRSHDT